VRPSGPEPGAGLRHSPGYGVTVTVNCGYLSACAGSLTVILVTVTATVVTPRAGPDTCGLRRGPGGHG
jgi:hypothetical protein